MRPRLSWLGTQSRSDRSPVNRFYIGEIVHRGGVHAGEHEPILDRDLFEAIQAKLAARLLRELGLTYLLDWCADDQPFALSVPGMMSVPYSIEINDITLCVGKSLSGEDFCQTIVDHFDQIYKESEQSGRVMALCLHPFVASQPHRHKYLERALDHISHHHGVWLTTSDEIAALYAANHLR